MSTRDVDDDKRQQRQQRSNNVNGTMSSISPLSNPNIAEHKRDNDDDNNDVSKQRRRQHNNDDDANSDDDDVDKQAHRHHVGSLGPGRTPRGGAGEGQGIRWTPACGAAAPPLDQMAVRGSSCLQRPKDRGRGRV